jgi:hypothetical protein
VEQLEDQSIMKIAAVLFILSVCYIANTEHAAIQAAPVPTGVRTYPSRPWKEMKHKAQQGMEDYKMKAKAFSQNAKAAQLDDPMKRLQELQECANQICPTGES